MGYDNSKDDRSFVEFIRQTVRKNTVITCGIQGGVALLILAVTIYLQLPPVTLVVMSPFVMIFMTFVNNSLVD